MAITLGPAQKQKACVSSGLRLILAEKCPGHVQNVEGFDNCEVAPRELGIQGKSSRITETTAHLAAKGRATSQNAGSIWGYRVAKTFAQVPSSCCANFRVSRASMRLHLDGRLLAKFLDVTWRPQADEVSMSPAKKGSRSRTSAPLQCRKGYCLLDLHPIVCLVNSDMDVFWPGRRRASGCWAPWHAQLSSFRQQRLHYKPGERPTL